MHSRFVSLIIQIQLTFTACQRHLNSSEAKSLYHPAPKWQRGNPHSDSALLFYYITMAPVDLSRFKEKVISAYTMSTGATSNEVTHLLLRQRPGSRAGRRGANFT